ncbi:secretin N-terminal domain-containing protein [Candidatus Omnitrophota bacterium]
MKRIIVFSLILFVGSQVAQVAWTQPEPAQPAELISEEQADPGPETLEEGLATEISLDLRGMDIVDTIKFLSMKGNLNIATSKTVSGRITLFLKNVSIADTLELILLTNSLAMEVDNNIITIMTEQEHEQLYGRKYADKREVRTLKLKYALPTRVGLALESLKGSIGKIIMDDLTGTLILIDTPENIAKMEQAALSLDRGIVEKESPTITKIYELEYAEAEELEKKIEQVLTEGFGSVKSDQRTNRIFIQDLPNKMKEIEEMVQAFDAKTREVVIEAKIVEITLNDEFAMGVNWEEILKGAQKDLQFTGTFPLSYPTGYDNQYGRMAIGTWKEGFYTDEGTVDEEWHAGTIDPRRTSKAITLLKALGKIKIVSSPHIAVCNNEEAKIMVGTRQPYATSTVSQSENTATTSWAAEFVDVGVTLTVTPKINKSGFVKIRIKPEVSTLTGWFEIKDENQVTQIRLPEVDTSNAETEVLVKDGRTIIIGGLLKNTDYKNKERLPILGDIPFIGGLFGSTGSGTKTKELVVFLTPRIITGGEDRLYAQERKTKKPKKE